MIYYTQRHLALVDGYVISCVSHVVMVTRFNPSRADTDIMNEML